MRGEVQIDVNVKSLFERNLTANSLVISVPVPPQTAKVIIKKSKGDAKYDGSAGVIRWSISKFRGQKEHKLSADVVLVSTTREKKPWTRCDPHTVVAVKGVGRQTCNLGQLTRSSNLTLAWAHRIPTVPDKDATCTLLLRTLLAVGLGRPACGA